MIDFFGISGIRGFLKIERVFFLLDWEIYEVGVIFFLSEVFVVRVFFLLLCREYIFFFMCF